MKKINVSYFVYIGDVSPIVFGFQIVRVVFVKHKSFFICLDGHIIAAPDVVGARQELMMYVIVVQYFDDVVKEGGADGWQPFREENGVGKGVGEHDYFHEDGLSPKFLLA